MRACRVPSCNAYIIYYVGGKLDSIIYEAGPFYVNILLINPEEANPDRTKFYRNVEEYKSDTKLKSFGKILSYREVEKYANAWILL